MIHFGPNHPRGRKFGKKEKAKRPFEPTKEIPPHKIFEGLFHGITIMELGTRLKSEFNLAFTHPSKNNTHKSIETISSMKKTLEDFIKSQREFLPTEVSSDCKERINECKRYLELLEELRKHQEGMK